MASRNGSRKTRQARQTTYQTGQTFNAFRELLQVALNEEEHKFADGLANEVLEVVSNLPESVIAHAVFGAIRSVVNVAAQPCADCGERCNLGEGVLTFDTDKQPQLELVPIATAGS